jgi:hypothetical protein
MCDSALLMAYGDACSAVGLRYVRDAAMNLALIPSLATPSVPAPPVMNPVPAEDVSSAKLGPIEVPPRRNDESDLSESDNDLPAFARDGLARENSSILKRLAGKFGFPK